MLLPAYRLQLVKLESVTTSADAPRNKRFLKITVIKRYKRNMKRHSLKNIYEEVHFYFQTGTLLNYELFHIYFQVF